MIINYFKIAWRNLVKNMGFTFINIGGLAIGITAYIFIMQYVKFESSYDNYQPNIEDLYRVTLTSNLGENGFVTLATNHPATGFHMSREFPEIENYTRLMDKSIIWKNFVLSYKDENGNMIKSHVSEDNLYVADTATLELFDVKLINGNSKNALSDPNSIILSKKVAKRFFGNQNPIDKLLLIDNSDPLKVTGVFEELPGNTHFKFDMLISLSTLGTWPNRTWNWPDFYNYVKLKPGTNPELIEAKFPDFINTYLGEIMDEHQFEARFNLQPVRDIHLKSNLINEMETNGSEKTLGFLRIIALFVILIALMNFINLSTAKSTDRALEVGLKKVVGIRKSALIFQFLFESIIINFIAALAAIILIILLMKPFNDLIGFEIISNTLWLKQQIWIDLLVLVIIGGILAGAYPAFVLSGFKPIEVLKGKFSDSEKGSFMRKGLVIAQFSISIALISGTSIVHKQYSFMRDHELGYDAEHSLILNAPMVTDSTIVNKIKTFKDEVSRNMNVKSITVTNEIPGKKITDDNIARRVGKMREEGVNCSFQTIDSDFIETFNIDMLAGRNFRTEDQTYYGARDEIDGDKPHRVIINREAVKSLGFKSPDDAIHKKIIFPLNGPVDRTVEIIGVIENYHQQSLLSSYHPIVFLNPRYYDARYITININTEDTKSAIASIEAKFDEFFPMDPFNFFFLNDYFNRQYQSHQKFNRIFLLFSGLAIFIASLGLFGLGSYMALKKTKELCVRKVLGANIFKVLILIPKSLLSLVLISGFIALPISYYLANEWLSDFAFRIDINFWMLIVPFLFVVLIAGLSVLPQSLKVSVINPAKYLRNE